MAIEIRPIDRRALVANADVAVPDVAATDIPDMDALATPPLPPTPLVAPADSPFLPRPQAPQTSVALADPTAPPPLGATPDASGTTFRVWAPNAQQVFVSGDFNGGQQTALAREANGVNFSTKIAGATAGQKFHYTVVAGGQTLTRLDPRSQQMTSGNTLLPDTQSVIVDHSKFVWTDSNFELAPIGQRLTYQLHVGTFNAIDGQSGTWRSAAARLDDLAARKINVIQILPGAAFKGDVNWGYDSLAPFAPAPQYGTPDDLKFFVNEAHKRGIAVYQDVVYNHLHVDNILSRWDGSPVPGDGIFFYPLDQRDDADSGYGPRPDFGRPEVRQYWIDSMVQWLKDYHFDGLRHDGTGVARFNKDGQLIPGVADFFAQLNTAVQTAKPGVDRIAEDLKGDPAITGSDGFLAQWDYGVWGTIFAEMAKINDGDRNMFALSNGLNQANSQLVVGPTHDRDSTNGLGRLSLAIDPQDPNGYFSRARALLGNVLIATSAGRPIFFQGDEQAEPTPFKFIADPFKLSNAAPMNLSRDLQFPGIVQAHADLFALRTGENPVARGLAGSHTDVYHLDNDNKVLAFHRFDKGGAGDDTVVIVNASNQPLSNYSLDMPSGGLWKVRFNSASKIYSKDFPGAPTTDMSAKPGGVGGSRFSSTVDLGPYSAVILSQDPSPV